MLIECKECGLQVSELAVYCPHCGWPVKMKISAKEAERLSRREPKHHRLPNGFGQISRIGGKNLRKPYRAMVTVGKNGSGHSVSRPLKPEAYFATYNEAYAALVEYNRHPYDLQESITVKELYKLWSEKYFKKLKNESSAKAVESAWMYCTSVYGMRAMDIRARHIKECLEEGSIMVRGQKKFPTAAMKNKIKSLFNLMLDYALEYEYVEKNYARTFKLTDETIKEIQTVKKEHIPYTDAEMELLWKHVDDISMVDIILVQCYSGWRPQELGLIELDNVDLKNGIYIGGIKTEAGINRVVPIHSRIRPIVERYYREAKALGSKFLFNYVDKDRRTSSTKLTYYRYTSNFMKIRDELGLDPNHRAHDGRKHFVTKAKEYGVDEYAIKYIVGHKIVDITEKVYTKRDTAWLKREIEKIK